MAGNVVVDEPDTEQRASLHVPAGWFLGLGAAVILVLMLLPGRPGTEVPPTSVTFPEVQLEEDRWAPIDMPGGGVLRDVAVLRDGSYVAVGDGPQVWRYDGEEVWEWMLDDTVGPGALTGVAAYRWGAVAVGAHEVDGSTRAPLLWRTTLGKDWQRLTLDVDGSAGLEGVFTSGSHAVAWGWQGTTRDFDPESRPLLLRSLDGQIWSPVDAFDDTDRLARILTVAHRDDVWYVGGYATGRPALWESRDDMRTWSRVDTRELPFGWAVREVGQNDAEGRVVTLINLSEGRARRWVEGSDGWAPLDEMPHDSIEMVSTNLNTLGVGNGRLWTSVGDGWEPLDLSGQVMAAAGRVAVGASPRSQPRVWMGDGDGGEVVSVPVGEGGRWESRRDLGESTFLGAWRVGEGWVIGGDSERWWYLEDSQVESFVPPWGDVFSEIVPAGDEWVALPSMHWSTTGLDWERRAVPWVGDSTGSRVEAVTEVDGRLLAVGRDSDFLWNVSASGDGGHSWTPVDQPMAATPLWEVAGTPEGLVATAARSQGSEEVVVSTNGRAWETVTEGHVLFGVQPPTALTADGSLLVFDTGEEVRPPRRDVTDLVRDGDDLILVAGGRLWIRDGDWQEIPLDPPHGMGAGWVHPLPMGDRLLAVGPDRGRLIVYEWRS